MNLAQKIAMGATLLAVAVFLFAGGHQTRKMRPVYVQDAPDSGSYSEAGLYPQRDIDVPRTAMDSIGILLVGGTVTTLLGIRRKE